MSVYKESFFRIFRSATGEPLRRFFENRHGRISAEMALERSGAEVIDRLLALALIEYDRDSGVYRLDDRVERFFDEMLGAVEAPHADWLFTLIDELKRQIEGYYKVEDTHKSGEFLRRICRLLGSCHSRMQRHLEDVKSAVDYDYRAGSDYEVKLVKLQWHLDRSRTYGQAIADLDHLLKNDGFFQFHQGIEVLSLRRRLLQCCGYVGDALVDIYQSIEEYLNRILKDHARVQKLIRLRGLIERHEHLTSTNIEEISREAEGPWFRGIQLRTLLAPAVVDAQPEVLERVLAKAGVIRPKERERKVEIEEPGSEALPPVIDWMELFEAFSRQSEDLFTFLGKASVEGRPLTDEERLDGYCAIISNEEWMTAHEAASYEMATEGEWEYAVILPRGERSE